MRSSIVLLLVLILMGVAQGEEQKADASAKVTGTITFFGDHPTINKLKLQILLYEYDPLLADVSATLIEKVDFKEFTHVTGKATEKKFEIGAKGKLNEQRGYYLSVFVLDGDKRVSMGVLDNDKSGIGKVLTNGQPREVKITAKPIR
ncbi:MAG: hypothetical protein U0894_03830 [Pirellulales bacterium]